MTSDSSRNIRSGSARFRTESSRLIGKIRGKAPGPTLICFGGIHGNEPAGVQALEELFLELSIGEAGLAAGTFVGIRGNLQANRQGRRFLDQDLNRMWLPERIRRIRSARKADLSTEEKELSELLALLEKTLREEAPPFYFIDLHTTSSPTLPFVTTNDAVINRKFAGLFPVPVILGIEEYLSGPLLSYINELGYVSIGFESGQHQDPEAVTAAGDFVWLALTHAGLLGSSETAEVRHRAARLREAARGDHHFYEVFHRHALERADLFRMVPGFRSFQPLPRGTLLAHDRDEPVYMARKGILFMPLYQELGEEGFFLIRRIPAWALRFSAWLRKFRFQDALAVLPGVRWAAQGNSMLLVDLRVARFFSKQVFHLLGYRAKQRDRTHLLLSNRERAARNEDYADTFWYQKKSVTP